MLIPCLSYLMFVKLKKKGTCGWVLLSRCYSREARAQFLRYRTYMKASNLNFTGCVVTLGFHIRESVCYLCLKAGDCLKAYAIEKVAKCPSNLSTSLPNILVQKSSHYYILHHPTILTLSPSTLFTMEAAAAGEDEEDFSGGTMTFYYRCLIIFLQKSYRRQILQIQMSQVVQIFQRRLDQREHATGVVRKRYALRSHRISR
jgi:hypothetical protein